MAMKAAYGFESGLVPNTFVSSSTLSIETSIVRNGGNSLKATAVGTSGSVAFPGVIVAASTDTFIFGIGIYQTQHAALFSLAGGSSAAINFYNDGSGNIGVYSATTATSSASGSLLGSFVGHTINSWVYYVAKIKFHDTTGLVEVWRDGVQVLNLTNIDTISSGSANTVRTVTGWRTGSNQAVYYDDVVFADSVGADLVDIFDPVKIEALRPTSDVAANWTRSTGSTSYTLVDEAPASSTDNISSSVATTKEEWGMADRALTGPILGLVGHAVGINLDGGAAALKIGLKRGGAENQSVGLGLASTTTHVQHVVENDPTTGIAWTDANANAVTMTAEVA